MKQISLFILLAINSYGQSHSKIVDTIVTKSVFIKTIELQNKKFDTKIHDLTNEFDNIAGSGNLDYVTGWYLKAAKYIQNTKIKVRISPQSFWFCCFRIDKTISIRSKKIAGANFTQKGRSNPFVSITRIS